MFRILPLLLIVFSSFSSLSWSQTCANSQSSIHVDFNCGFAEHIYDPRLGDTSLRPLVPFGADGSCSFFDPLLFKFRAANKVFARKRADQVNFISQGLDPATLVPQGLDLSFFPAFELSPDLVLRPVLSFSTMSEIERRGDLRFNAPKVWQSHYGELVRVLSSTHTNRRPLGELIPNAQTIDERNAVPQEIQTYYTNAAGEEVNFYPDPAQFNGDTPFDTDGDGRPGPLSRWFSDESIYRLESVSTGLFRLDSPEGLTFEFEVYKSVVDPIRESMSLHYRVRKISDRVGNYIEVLFASSSDIRPQRPAPINHLEPEYYRRLSLKSPTIMTAKTVWIILRFLRSILVTIQVETNSE